jgi:hypothetical protein
MRKLQLFEQKVSKSQFLDVSFGIFEAKFEIRINIKLVLNLKFKKDFLGIFSFKL